MDGITDDWHNKKIMKVIDLININYAAYAIRITKTRAYTSLKKYLLIVYEFLIMVQTN
jgi:hypothetical protein